MADKKIIAVVGATGAQGGGLVRAILNDPDGGFAARALTRNTSSDKAQELKKLGAEVVAFDVNDPASVKSAFDGAYGAYCVTFFWDHFSPQKENEHAKTMAEAAKAAGVKHVVWSTLEDTRKWVPLDDDRMPTLMEQYKVPHLDAKGESNHYFSDAGVPTTFLHTSFYWDNFIHFGMGPQKGQDGAYAITMPLGKAKMPGIAAEDIGKCAYGIFKAGPEYINKSVGISGGHLSGDEMAASLSKALGFEVKYNDVEPSIFRSFGFPGAEDLGNMFQFKRDFEDDFRKARSIDFTKKIDPELQSFDQWLERNKSLIPIE